MSSNENTIHIFVKGHKGLTGFVITNKDGALISDYEIEECRTNKDEPMDQFYSDLISIKKSLTYVKDNTGKNKIPNNPYILIFSNSENIFHTEIKDKREREELYISEKEEIESLMTSLAREKKNRGNVDDNVRVLFIPRKLEVKTEELITKMEERKKANKRKGFNKP